MSIDMPKTGTWQERGGWCVLALMHDVGLRMVQAAGFVGNLGYESRGFEDLHEIAPTVPGSKGGRGWGQWTGYVPPNDRRKKFEDWCDAKNLCPESDEANYSFIVHELNGQFLTFAYRLRQTTTIADACHLTHRIYERPADAIDGTYRSGPVRLSWAQRAYKGAAARQQR